MSHTIIFLFMVLGNTYFLFFLLQPKMLKIRTPKDPGLYLCKLESVYQNIDVCHLYFYYWFLRKSFTFNFPYCSLFETGPQGSGPINNVTYTFKYTVHITIVQHNKYCSFLMQILEKKKDLKMYLISTF